MLPPHYNKRRVAIVNDTSGRGHHGCDLVVSEIEKGLTSVGFRVGWRHPVAQDWRPVADELASRPRVDAIIVNGEGSIHHSRSQQRAVYLAEFGAFARNKLNVPAYLINSTIFDIDNDTASNISLFSDIFVRDHGSNKELSRYGIYSNVVSDLTIGATLPIGNFRNGVCVVDSVVKESNYYLRSLAKDRGWAMRSMKEPREYPADWKTWGRLEGVNEFAQYLSSHEFVVTGRFHTVTMCIATKTPFVAIESNTPKISWLLDDVFGSRRRLLEPQQLYALQVNQFSFWLPDEENSIMHSVELNKTGSAEMFSRIARKITDI